MSDARYALRLTGSWTNGIPDPLGTPLPCAWDSGRAKTLALRLTEETSLGESARRSAKRTPWIDPSGAAADEIAAAIRTCPSGALSYSIEGVEFRDQERSPAILVSSNGPYYVSGGIELADAPWGAGASREHYTLCRCGGSKNKSFCDGTHRSIGFTDEKN